MPDLNTVRVMTFRIEIISDEALRTARDEGVDTSGNPVQRMAADGGEQLRCCLRGAVAGEPILLFGYEPVLPGPSPYREIGAVYAHATECSGPESVTAYPSHWRGEPQVLRAYDERGWIHPASRSHDGLDPERHIAEVLAVPGVVRIDTRNIAYGCYGFTVTG